MNRAFLLANILLEVLGVRTGWRIVRGVFHLESTSDPVLPPPQSNLVAEGTKSETPDIEPRLKRDHIVNPRQLEPILHFSAFGRNPPKSESDPDPAATPHDKNGYNEPKEHGCIHKELPVV